MEPAGAAGGSPSRSPPKSFELCQIASGRTIPDGISFALNPRKISRSGGTVDFRQHFMISRLGFHDSNRWPRWPILIPDNEFCDEGLLRTGPLQTSVLVATANPVELR